MSLQEVSHKVPQQSPTMEISPPAFLGNNLDEIGTNQLPLLMRLKLFVVESLKELAGFGISEEVIAELRSSFDLKESGHTINLSRDSIVTLIEGDSELKSAIDLKVGAHQMPFSNSAFNFHANAKRKQQQLEALGALYFYARLARADPILSQSIANSVQTGIEEEDLLRLKQFYKSTIFPISSVNVKLLTRETQEQNNTAETAILAGIVHGLCDLKRENTASFTERIKHFFGKASSVDTSLSALDNDPIPADVLRLLFDCIDAEHVHQKYAQNQIVQEKNKVEVERREKLGLEVEKLRISEASRVEIARYAAEEAQAKAREAELVVAREQARMLANNAQKEASLAETKKLLELKEAHRLAKEAAEAEDIRLRQEQKLAETNEIIKARELRAAVSQFSSNKISLYAGSPSSTEVSLPQDPNLALEVISRVTKIGGVPKLEYSQRTALVESLKSRDLDIQIKNPDEFLRLQTKWRTCIEELNRSPIAFNLSKEQVLAIQAEGNLPTNYFKSCMNSEMISLSVPRGCFSFRENGWGQGEIRIKNGSTGGSKFIAESDSSFWLLTALIEQRNSVDRVP